MHACVCVCAKSAPHAQESGVIIKKERGISHSEGKAEVKQELGDAKPVYVYDLMAKPRPTITKLHSNGCKETVDLETGPAGFLVGKFANDDTHTTELANLILTIQRKPVKKRPAECLVKKGEKTKEKKAKKQKKKKKKKKETSSEEDAADAEGEDTDVDANPEVKAEPAKKAAPQKYRMEYYKNHNCIGIKQNFGTKSQIMSFGGMKCGKSESELRAIGKTVVADLTLGLDKTEVLSKARNLVAA